MKFKIGDIVTVSSDIAEDFGVSDKVGYKVKNTYGYSPNGMNRYKLEGLYVNFYEHELILCDPLTQLNLTKSELTILKDLNNDN